MPDLVFSSISGRLAPALQAEVRKNAFALNPFYLNQSIKFATCWLLARIAGKLIGCVGWRLHYRRMPSKKVLRFVHIYLVYCHQKKGRILMKEMLKTCSVEDYIVLDSIDEVKVIGFYEKLGFVKGLLPIVGLPSVRCNLVVSMYKVSSRCTPLAAVDKKFFVTELELLCDLLKAHKLRVLWDEPDAFYGKWYTGTFFSYAISTATIHIVFEDFEENVELYTANILKVQ